MKFFLFAFWVALLIQLCAVLPAEAYLERTHEITTIEAVRLVEELLPAEYREIVQYRDALIRGAMEEDSAPHVGGNERSFRHFFDPDAEPGREGLRYRTYFKIWSLFGARITIPEGHFYPSALEWGRDGAGSGDPYNWEGALRVYDAADGSRQEAYRRLGHVAHLIQDLAQPDHATSTAHPGSLRRYERGGVIYYGFERLVDDHLLPFQGQTIRQQETFDDFFIDMARTTKEVYRKRGFTVPVGLKEFLFSGVYWTPDIAFEDAEPYLELARDLLTYSAEKCAGLFQFFRDIVNPPPFVQEVVVIQDVSSWGAGGGYRAAWQDTIESGPEGFPVLRERSLDREASPFFTGIPVTVRIRFGPPGKTMDHQSILVNFLGEELSGALVEPGLWEGRFVPYLPLSLSGIELPLVIQAQDQEAHYPRENLPETGYHLDTEPSRPSRLASYQPPYPWKNYEPGFDRFHRLFLINPEIELVS